MGSVVFKAEAGRGGLAGWGQLVDAACSVTFFSRAVPPLESHPAQTRNCEESSFHPLLLWTPKITAAQIYKQKYGNMDGKFK